MVCFVTTREIFAKSTSQSIPRIFISIKKLKKRLKQPLYTRNSLEFYFAKVKVKGGKRMANVQKTFALILGIVLLIIGIWGFFPGQTSILGFGVNPAQSVLHVIAGLFGVYVGVKGMGPGFNMSIGWIGVVLGVLGFIPSIGHGKNELLMTWFNINMQTSVLHIVIGVIALIVAYTVKE
jgi:hypothetical protein